MTLDELARTAVKSINETPKEITPTIVIMMPGIWRKSNRKRLCKGGPIGNIINETNDGITVIFDAIDILSFCAANGVNVKVAKL